GQLAEVVFAAPEAAGAEVEGGHGDWFFGLLVF
ncbi:MAG: hypothetical protein ACJAZ9_002120, partial [Neolewinella sp.]